ALMSFMNNLYSASPKLLPHLPVLFWRRVDGLPSDPVQPCNAFDQPGGQRIGALFLRYDVERLDDAASQIGHATEARDAAGARGSIFASKNEKGLSRS
ncbi:MAG: hypothetical protein V7606_4174, partial [Burkholderiales bacterium]